MTIKLRPIFFLNNEQDKQIKAGGIIFYRLNKKTKQTEFLLIKCNNKYEDFGGKTDPDDNSIEETAAREAEEESNNIFNRHEILKNIDKADLIYSKFSKYLIYFIKTNVNYEPSKFGSMEIFEKIPRTVEWVSYSKIRKNGFSKKYLHIRLLFNDFFKKISDINDSMLNISRYDILSELDRDLYELEKYEMLQHMQQLLVKQQMQLLKITC